MTCSYIAQTAYKHRHDQVAKFSHWKLLAKYSIDVGSCWWKHQPSPVVENSQCKIIWDFTIIADRPICRNRPDVVVVYKQNNKGYFIDVTIPGNACIKMKTTEKLNLYRDLQIIIQQLWGMLISIVPIVIRALGSVSLDHSKWLKVFDFDYQVILLIQKTVVLGTFNILRRYLSAVP